MAWVAGIDGCRAGWVVVLCHMETGEVRQTVLPEISGIVTLPENPTSIAIDMPIGLLDEAVRGGRGCDRQARRILGSPRSSSVFSPPVRTVLKYNSYGTAKRANEESSPLRIGISKQAYALTKKIREVDEFVRTSGFQGTVKEVHPELCFFELSGGKPMQHNKKSTPGFNERKQLLEQVGFLQVIAQCSTRLRSVVAKDDVLDACVSCWTAGRILLGKAIRIPDIPEVSCEGLFMEMWR